MKGNKFILFGDSINANNTELTEGKSVSYLGEEDHIDWSQVVCSYANDETGRVFKGRIPKELRNKKRLSK
jgi:hypothetical protein